MSFFIFIGMNNGHATVGWDAMPHLILGHKDYFCGGCGWWRGMGNEAYPDKQSSN
jgi:hypothetical protein